MAPLAKLPKPVHCAFISCLFRWKAINEQAVCVLFRQRRKARSAILIFRGRVVGCLYGAKKLDAQCLQEDAHRYALADLASPGNILDAYELPEELVLAAASLFNGEILDTNVGENPQQCFDLTMRNIAETQLPGCIVVNTGDDEEMISAWFLRVCWQACWRLFGA